jgi:2-amino-4-hydroxy-6-hydroxymethyldihydropteridine diphosphokinase
VGKKFSETEPEDMDYEQAYQGRQMVQTDRVMANKQMFLIALGGNLPTDAGPPEATVTAALAALGREGATVDAVSRLFRTPCFPPGAGPDYVNAAARVTADLTARELLELLHRIEARFGRERVQRWGMRTLDLDLLAAGG